MTIQIKARTKGSFQYEPDALFESWTQPSNNLSENNDFKSSIISTFNLPQDDSYVYHATASVTLSQVQGAIDHGGKSGLHAWYLDEKGAPVRYSHQYC